MFLCIMRITESSQTGRILYARIKMWQDVKIYKFLPSKRFIWLWGIISLYIIASPSLPHSTPETFPNIKSPKACYIFRNTVHDRLEVWAHVMGNTALGSHCQVVAMECFPSSSPSCPRLLLSWLEVWEDWVLWGNLFSIVLIAGIVQDEFVWRSWAGI